MKNGPPDPVFSRIISGRKMPSYPARRRRRAKPAGCDHPKLSPPYATPVPPGAPGARYCRHCQKWQFLYAYRSLPLHQQAARVACIRSFKAGTWPGSAPGAAAAQVPRGLPWTLPNSGRSKVVLTDRSLRTRKRRKKVRYFDVVRPSPTERRRRNARNRRRREAKLRDRYPGPGKVRRAFDRVRVTPAQARARDARNEALKDREAAELMKTRAREVEEGTYSIGIGPLSIDISIAEYLGWSRAKIREALRRMQANADYLRRMR